MVPTRPVSAHVRSAGMRFRWNRWATLVTWLLLKVHLLTVILRHKGGKHQLSERFGCGKTPNGLACA